LHVSEGKTKKETLTCLTQRQPDTYFEWKPECKILAFRDYVVFFLKMPDRIINSIKIVFYSSPED